MTTTNVPKQPATPYDWAIEAKRPVRPGVGVHAYREELAKREGYLRRQADLAPLHRQLVEALKLVSETTWVRRMHDAQETYVVQIDAMDALRAALDAARKAGL